MFALIKLLRAPRNFYPFKNVIQKCPRRNQNSSSTFGKLVTLKVALKSTLMGFTVGVPIGILLTNSYTSYSNTEVSKPLFGSESTQKIEALIKKPQVPISRQVFSPVDSTGLKLTLLQYQSCPFCCKVRVFLDYFGLSYDVVEVDPVLRNEIKWSGYKKVPIVLAQTDSGYQPLVDSSMIISLLTSYLKDRSLKIDDLIKYYPRTLIHSKKKSAKHEILNKYFIIYEENSIMNKDMDNNAEERKWRMWADDVLVHTLSPNVYRTLGEAYKTLIWFSEVGRWKEYFPTWERLLVINVGAIAMWLISMNLKHRYNLKDDVRQSLYDEVNTWLCGIKKRGGTFMGGEKPNLSDLAVYGILKSIEGCDAFKDVLNNTQLKPWYDAMTKEVDTHSGSKYLVN